MHRFIALLVTALMLGAPLSVAATTSDSSLEQVLVESATTPQQHAALAHYYEDKAKAARAEAESHRTMGKTYSGAKATQLAAMKDHCDKLAKLYEDEAKEFDAMAKMHRDMAK